MRDLLSKKSHRQLELLELLFEHKRWLKDSPKPLLTLLMAPFGLLLYLLILWKNRN